MRNQFPEVICIIRMLTTSRCMPWAMNQGKVMASKYVKGDFSARFLIAEHVAYFAGDYSSFCSISV